MGLEGVAGENQSQVPTSQRPGAGALLRAELQAQLRRASRVPDHEPRLQPRERRGAPKTERSGQRCGACSRRVPCVRHACVRRGALRRGAALRPRGAPGVERRGDEEESCPAQ